MTPPRGPICKSGSTYRKHLKPLSCISPSFSAQRKYHSSPRTCHGWMGQFSPARTCMWSCGITVYHYIIIKKYSSVIIHYHTSESIKTRLCFISIVWVYCLLTLIVGKAYASTITAYASQRTQTWLYCIRLRDACATGSRLDKNLLEASRTKHLRTAYAKLTQPRSTPTWSYRKFKYVQVMIFGSQKKTSNLSSLSVMVKSH